VTAPDPLARMKTAILQRRRLAEAKGEKMFMGIPDDWYSRHGKTSSGARSCSTTIRARAYE